MNRLIRIVIFTIVLIGFTAFSASAENSLDEIYNEQLEASGAEDLWNSIPAETRQFLYNIGITGFNADSITEIKPDNVTDSLLTLLKESAAGPFRAAGVLLGIVLLYALMEGTRQTVKEESISKIFGVICAITACAALIVPISVCIKDVSKAAESTSVLMISFVPVYAGVMLVSGQAVSAASYQTVMLFAAELISLVATKLIVPLMTVSLALSLTGSVTPGIKLGSAGGLINKSCGWLLGLTSTIFVGLLSVQELVGAAADTVTVRAIKFSLGAFVPVVGSTLGEAFNSVKSCLSLLKSTLGGFGIISTVLIILPPLIECVLWLLSLSFCTMAAEIFSLDSVASLFKAAQGVLKTLIGVLAACSMFIIVATTIVTLAGGNV